MDPTLPPHGKGDQIPTGKGDRIPIRLGLEGHFIYKEGQKKKSRGSALREAKHHPRKHILKFKHVNSLPNLLSVKHLLRCFYRADQRGVVKPLNDGNPANRFLIKCSTSQKTTFMKQFQSLFRKNISKTPKNAEIHTRWECALPQNRWRHQPQQIWIYFESLL